MTQWGEYRFVERATVLKKEHRAGQLVRREGGVEFRYFDEYLQGRGEAIASTLPLSDQPTFRAAGAVPPYFAGLLPEGRRLQAVRTAVKTSLDDELSLLLAVGADPVGDVRVLPEGVEPDEVAPRAFRRDGGPTCPSRRSSRPRRARSLTALRCPESNRRRQHG